MIPVQHFLSGRALRAQKTEPIQHDYGEQLSSIDHPRIPFIVSGLFFETDYVICFASGELAMLEICRTFLGNDEIWFTLESTVDGIQRVGLHEKDKEIADALFLSFPIKSYFNHMSVEDDGLFYDVTYIDRHDEKQRYRLKKVKKRQKAFFYNGHTMNHSHDIANPVIYLESLNWLSEQSCQSKHLILKKMGLPIRFLISQTVCALTAGSLRQDENTLFLNEHAVDMATSEGDNKICVRIGKLIGADYIFSDQEGHFELKRVKTWQNVRGVEVELGEVHIAVPDMRFRVNEWASSYGHISIHQKCLGHFNLTKEGSQHIIDGTRPSWFKRTLGSVVDRDRIVWSVV